MYELAFLVQLARSTAGFLRNSLKNEAVFMPSMVFIDDLSKWCLVVFLENLPENATRFLPEVQKHDHIEIAELKLFMSGKNRSDIKAGVRVQIVQKQNQRTGKLTEGVVKDVLTKASTHPHGIKVRLTTGAVGRVKKIIEK